MEPRTLGAFIRAWRKDEARLTQEELADKIKVSQAAITDWERGAARPGAGPMIALADAMGIHPRLLQNLPSEKAKTSPVDPVAKTDPPPSGDVPPADDLESRVG